MTITIIIYWEKCCFKELNEFEDTYFYAVTHGRKLIYIGSSMAENGLYNEVHHNAKDFGWDRKKITIWPGYVSYKGRITESLIRNVEKLMIYKNQPRDNKYYKDPYSGMDKLKVINKGCPYLKRIIRQ